ncbi:MAG: hypothetical protein M3O36_09835 [Myxococcota bacterium]|nr:hypothetical protein [Myxococcota bacterium]
MKPRPKPDPKEPDEDRAPLLRAEPAIAPPQDPLVMSPEARERVGSDWTSGPPSPEGQLLRRRWFPFYEEVRGDYRLRLVPPVLIEVSRGLRDPTQRLYGVPQAEDTEGLYSLLYYRRRSPRLDMDVIFPAFWRVHEGRSKALVIGPLAHREAPGEHDNWLAPLLFEGERRDGGYFHAPLLLTTSHWGAEGAFTLVGPYFRSRTGSDIDTGVAPIFFHGDNGDLEGNGRSYTLIPPLLFYHADHEFEGTSLTIAGPVVAQSDPKRAVLDVAPLFFHIHGKPESGGVAESHTTLFPLFHYGRTPEQSLFIVPGYYRRVTATSDALLSLFYSHVEGRNGATSLTAAGPVVPLWWSYSDRDIGLRSWALAPLFFRSDSPTGHDWLTPLVGRFEKYGESRTWWVFPTLTLASDTHGFENDFHPIVYTGRTDDSTHTVVAPIFWDFADPKGRTTIGFPVYWRFAEGADDSVVQVAANTVYVQKRVAGGHDWQFHLVPLFSYGESPNGYFWNVLFGLAGFTRQGTGGQVRALWIPFDFGGAPATNRTATTAR